VANPLPLYSTPSDDLIWAAGLSMTNEDATYPVANGTSWTLVLSRSAGIVWVGRISLVTAVYPLDIKHGTWQVGRRRPAEITIETRGGHVLKHSYGVRTRWAKGVVDLIDDEAAISAMDLKATGSVLPFLLVPDENENDAWFVRQTTEYAKDYAEYDVRATSLMFEELSSGPVNG